MHFPYEYKKVFTILLVLTQLCLPLSGPLYISSAMGNSEESRSGLICEHSGSEPNHNTQDNDRQIAHCHVIDAPCLTTSAISADYRPLTSKTTPLNKGVLLQGYESAKYIPPEYSL